MKDNFARENDVVCGTISYHAEWNSEEGLEHTPASSLIDITPLEAMASLVRFAENGRFVELSPSKWAGWNTVGRLTAI